MRNDNIAMQFGPACGVAPDIRAAARPGPNTKTSIGIVGYGAFGQLAADHLSRDFAVCVHDPACAEPGAAEAGAAETGKAAVTIADLATVAASDIVLLAVPVTTMAHVVQAIAPHLKPGAVVLDVCSVKMEPARIMLDGLPDHVHLIATHPLFGPQSAQHGIAGLKIAVCPLRGRRARIISRFLARQMELEVVLTTPEDHDREAAVVQGLTHLVARIMMRMEDTPGHQTSGRITTRSYELLQQAIDMVRHDTIHVTHAIEAGNPFSAPVRQAFHDNALAVLEEAGLR